MGLGPRASLMLRVATWRRSDPWAHPQPRHRVPFGVSGGRLETLWRSHPSTTSMQWFNPSVTLVHTPRYSTTVYTVVTF